MKECVHRLREALKDHGIDAFISYDPKNTRYLSGMKAVTRKCGHVVLSTQTFDMVTTFLNREQAENECDGCDHIIVTDSTNYTMGDYLREKGFQTVAIEEEFLTVKELEELQSFLPDAKFVHGSDLLNNVKRIKSPDEIVLLKKAAEITDRIFASILTMLKPGVTERDIERAILDKTKEYGAEKCSFEPIVVSGKRSSLPHGVPTDKKLESGDFLTIDMGVVYEGYHSDFTRTVVLGKASGKQKEIYEIVKMAQQAAVEMIRPGMTGREADKIARDIITEAGYGPNFGHSLGHGLMDGIRLVNSPAGEFHLKENMVFTIEPGIYIENFGGVRIEDVVLLTKDGCVPLFNTTKELLELDF